MRTVEEIKKEMQECVNNIDLEAAHYDADELLCELLNQLGYSDIVDLYNLVGKWYA